MEKRRLKSEMTIVAKESQLGYRFFDREGGFIYVVVKRKDKCIRNNFYFGVNIVRDQDPKKILHCLEFIHEEGKECVIIKLYYGLKRIVDYRVLNCLSDEEIRKRRIWYCPLEQANNIRTLKEIIDHFTKRFANGKE